MCMLIVRGGTMPAKARVLVGVIGPHADEVRVTDHGRLVRRYRVSRTRVDAPARMAPFLVQANGVRSVQSFGDGVRLYEVRFPVAW